MMQRIRDWYRQQTKFNVLVNWDGLVVEHWADSYEEAIEWAQCYPICFVHCTKAGKFVWLRRWA